MAPDAVIEQIKHFDTEWLINNGMMEKVNKKQDLMQTKPKPWNRSFLEPSKKYRNTKLKIGRSGLWMSELKINMKKDYFQLDPFERIRPTTLRKRENCSWRQKKSMFLIQMIQYDTVEVFNVLDHKSEICTILRMQRLYFIHFATSSLN